MIIEDIDPAELGNGVCPFPEREYCEGCGNYLEDEGVCAKEIELLRQL